MSLLVVVTGTLNSEFSFTTVTVEPEIVTLPDFCVIVPRVKVGASVTACTFTVWVWVKVSVSDSLPFVSVTVYTTVKSKLSTLSASCAVVFFA